MSTPEATSCVSDQKILCIPGTDFPMLELSPVESGHANMIWEWINDPRAKCWLDLGGGRQDLTRRELYLLLTNARNHARLFRLPGGTEPLGLICLNDVSNMMGSADVWGVRGVYAGAPANVSVSAFLHVLATAFVDLERHVVGSWVVDGNLFSVAMHVKLGFQQCGRQRGRHIMNDRHYDRLLFDLTREEFTERFSHVPAESGRTLAGDRSETAAATINCAAGACT